MIDTIYIYDIAIHEPVTVFTDFLTTLFCFIFCNKIKNVTNDQSVQNWRFFFLFFGCSTFVGGCSHAFFEIHSGWMYKTFWLAMQVFNGFAVFAAQMATFNSVLKNSKNKNSWYLSYTIQLFIFLAAVFIFQNFLAVVINNMVGLIPVMILHFADAKKVKASGFIAKGILISFLTAIVHGTKLSLYENFNSNDLSHVLIMASLSVVYIGVSKRTLFV